MSTTAMDLRHAARGLRRTPAFALVATLTLALGIGASTAIFSVVNAVLLRPLPYADPDRLVLVWGELRTRNLPDFPFSPPDYQDLRQEATLFQEFGAVSPFQQGIGGDGEQPEQVRGAGVTTNLLSMLGARVAVGRPFVADDALPQPGAAQGGNAPPAAAPDAPQLPAIVILNPGFWRRRYGGDPAIVGKSIDFGGQRAQVVGVLAPGFELLFPPVSRVDAVPDIFVAMRLDFENASRNNVFLRVVGRLKPGVPLARAEDQVERVAADLRRRFPISEAAGFHIGLVPMHEDLVAEVRPAILALMGAVGFVLLIACANVANLLLVRASGREREMAVRAALGSSPWRLVRQLLAESLVLAAAGALLGLGVAYAGIKLLVALAPTNLPRLDAVRIDPLVLAFTVLVSAAAAVLFGLIPALRASRPDLAETLRTGRTPGLHGGKLLRNVVVVAEVALSFVLLIGCGLMVRTFVALQRTDPGYDPRNVLTFVVNNPIPQTADARAAFVRQLRERLAALPNVQSVTAANPLPLDGQLFNSRWGTEAAVTDPSKFQQANVHIVLPGYFETMRTRLIAGRTFTDADNVDSTTTNVIIDSRLAAKAFPNESAIGKRLYVRSRGAEPEWVDVIGVVAHQRHETLAAEGREAIFFTDAFFNAGAVARWAVRTTGNPAQLGPAARAVVAELEPRIPVAELQPMQALVDRAIGPTRFSLVLIAVFAVIAAVLAAVGLYGVLSTVVRQRTAEIGVRMAFGAESRSIFRLVIGEGLRLSGVGIVVGVLAALMLTRMMSALLVGVRPTDPATFATIAATFFVVAAAACWLPARRAAGLDPTSALRED
ncbi:MAG TPA: ABC transporter permease [Gemmatimonadaceae bacterium]|nr:ABC transporter permease [Gemmatimonadaceae bacterium]